MTSRANWKQICSATEVHLFQLQKKLLWRWSDGLPSLSCGDQLGGSRDCVGYRRLVFLCFFFGLFVCFLQVAAHHLRHLRILQIRLSASTVLYSAKVVNLMEWTLTTSPSHFNKLGLKFSSGPSKLPFRYSKNMCNIDSKTLATPKSSHVALCTRVCIFNTQFPLNFCTKEWLPINLMSTAVFERLREGWLQSWSHYVCLYLWMQWPTCMMTSRTRAGVKVRQLAIENVWGIPNACWEDPSVCHAERLIISLR